MNRHIEAHHKNLFDDKKHDKQHAISGKLDPAKMEITGVQLTNEQSENYAKTLKIGKQCCAPFAANHLFQTVIFVNMFILIQGKSRLNVQCARRLLHEIVN